MSADDRDNLLDQPVADWVRVELPRHEPLYETGDALEGTFGGVTQIYPPEVIVHVPGEGPRTCDGTPQLLLAISVAALKHGAPIRVVRDDDDLDLYVRAQEVER